MKLFLCTFLLAAIFLLAAQPAKSAVPDDFPRFTVPGIESEMDTMRRMYWLHYPGSGPKSTMWDEWLATPGLWPAVESEGYRERMAREWKQSLLGRIVDSDGYVAVHQHPSITHQLGWPFPFWNQGLGGYGWHFSFQHMVGPPWRQGHLSPTEGWRFAGIQAADELAEEGWLFTVQSADATIETPEQIIDTFQAPFLQFRWTPTGLGKCRPFIEWIPEGETRYHPSRRMEFEMTPDGQFAVVMVPLYRHPQWEGRISRIRMNLGNENSEGAIAFQGLWTHYDTRHNINSQVFNIGSANTFWWTGDTSFLRANINRMRQAMRYVMSEHQALKARVVVTDSWVGHDGRPGLELSPEGVKSVHWGRGVGNNYWDLLPFGGRDAYATVRYYVALKNLARLEREIRENPGWNIPTGMYAFDPDELERHAEEVRQAGQKMFWVPETGRFAAAVDSDGKKHDWGLVFHNLEMVHYGFASPAQARQIMDWIEGRRIVEGDTAQGADIYHWRFGPRSTTKRNIVYYGFFWHNPESIPWGGQVQDGGAVFGFTYHDLMSRIAVSGPDSAWERLQEIITWFNEVEAAGGYRKYYEGHPEATLQGGGTAGGLGLDSEFFESVLASQVMLDGFLGFKARGDGFLLNPRLPSAFPSLTVSKIGWQDLVLEITATNDEITIRRQGRTRHPEVFIGLPDGNWQAWITRPNGSEVTLRLVARKLDGAYGVDLSRLEAVRFKKQ